MKKFIFILLSFAIILSLCTSAFAAKSPETQDPAYSKEGFRQRFSELSENQRRQIYKLGDKIIDQMKKLAEKYAEFGMISSEDAENVIEAISKRNEVLKQRGLPVPFPLPHKKLTAGQ